MWYLASILGLVGFALLSPLWFDEVDFVLPSLVMWAWIGIALARAWPFGLIMLIGQWVGYAIAPGLPFVSYAELPLVHFVIVPAGIAMALETWWVVTLLRNR